MLSIDIDLISDTITIVKVEKIWKGGSLSASTYRCGKALILHFFLCISILSDLNLFPCLCIIWFFNIKLTVNYERRFYQHQIHQWREFYINAPSRRQPPFSVHVIILRSHDHCRQRAPIENVWSTSGIF